jgi:hypothetical protein
VALDPARRALLLQTKLRAIAAEHFGLQQAEPVPYLAGAGLFDAEQRQLVALVEPAQLNADPLDVEASVPRPPRGWLGGLIVLGARRNAVAIHVLADEDLLNGVDAWRAERSRIPVSCWALRGRSLQQLDPKSVTRPAGLGDLTSSEQQFAPLIEANGAVAVVENGVLRAEVLGLEVARVLPVPTADDADQLDGRPTFELGVGVGKHDRLAQAMMHSGTDPAVALSEAVTTVLDHRRPGALPHPANTSSRSRWLREILVADPARFGFRGPVERLVSTVPIGLKQSGLAPARGIDGSGRPVVIGCSVGVDLDAPVELLDHLSDSSMYPILLVPDGDELPALTTVCATLSPSVRVMSAGDPFGGEE